MNAHLCTLAVVFLLVSAHSADWRMMGRDRTRNRVSPEENAPTNWDLNTGKNVKWKATVGYASMSEPVVADGLVWIGGNIEDHGEHQAGVLIAFRESDGTLFHQETLPMREISPGIKRRAFWGLTGSPYIEGNRLWFVTPTAEVICLQFDPADPTSVRKLWEVDLTEFAIHLAVDLMGGKGICSIAGFQNYIYAITGHGQDWTRANIPRPDAPALICLDKNNGNLIWEDNSPGHNILFGEFGSPLIFEAGGVAHVVAPQGDGWVRSFDALTGELLWKFDINPKKQKDRWQKNFFLNAPVSYKGKVYIAGGRDIESGDGEGRLVCLDPTHRGDISLELESPAGVITTNANSGAVWHFERLGRSMTLVAIQDDLLIAAGFDGPLYCLDATTGQEFWRHDLGGRIIASPLIADGKVYAATEDGDVFIFKLDQAKELIAKRSANAPIYSSLVLANNILYLRAGGHIYAIQQPSSTQQLAGSWPQWRGPDRSNASRETGLLKEWPEGGPERLWTVDGLGDGIHAVSVAEGRVFTTGNLEGKEVLFSLDVEEGRKLWSKTLGQTVPENPLMRWLTQRSPTIDNDRTYTLTANGELFCLVTSDGKELWRKDYREFGAPHPVFGFTDYPLVDGASVICTPYGTDAFIVALNKRTGTVNWATALPEPPRAGYAPITASEAGGVRQYVVLHGNGLTSFAANDGKELWSYTRPVRIGATFTPIALQDYIFSPNGYGGGLILLKVQRTATGWSVDEQYHLPERFDPFHDSTSVVGQHVYMAREIRLPSCFEPLTGKVLWTAPRERFPANIALTSADGRLYVRSGNGTMVLLDAAPDGYKERGSFEIPRHETSRGVTFPVVADGRLFLRDSARLHCYNVSASSASTAPREITLSPSQLSISEVGETPRVGRDRAPDAVFVPTPQDVVAKMLEVAGVTRESVLVDLGSGDGRILIQAAQRYGCRAIGYEIDPRLVTLSREEVAKANFESLVRIEHQDIFTQDLGNADVVTVFLYPRLMERLMPQLSRLKPGARVVSHQFEIPGIPPKESIVMDSEESGEKHRILLWTAPIEISSMERNDVP